MDWPRGQAPSGETAAERQTTALSPPERCWTSEGFYGTTCASGGFPTYIRCFLLLSYFFSPPKVKVKVEGTFFFVFSVF